MRFEACLGEVDIQLVNVLGCSPIIEALEVLGQDICLYKHLVILIKEARNLLGTPYSKSGKRRDSCCNTPIGLEWDPISHTVMSSKWE